MNDVLNFLALAFSLMLLFSSAILIRGANGTRPLLIGFMCSSLFAVYLSGVRVLSLQLVTSPFFGIILCFWILTKLWTLWATALHTPHPFRRSISELIRHIREWRRR